MKWVETTLRKGANPPKICRDMFIVKHHKEYQLCKIANGNVSERNLISLESAREYIKTHSLIERRSDIFKVASTYRTAASWAVVDALLEAQS